MPLEISWLQVVVDAVAHVVADALAATIFVGSVALASRRRWRSEVRRLFGVEKLVRDTIKLRLSRIQVVPKGTRGTIPITNGFDGPAMTEAEYDLAQSLADAIQSPPLVGLLRAATERLGVRTIGIPIICDVRASDSYPTGELDRAVDLGPDSGDARRIAGELRSGPYILIGSPVYNILSRYVLEYAGPQYSYFDYLPTPGRGFTVTRYGCSGGTHSRWVPRTYRRRDKDGDTGYVEYFVVQKFPAKKFGTVVFLACGTSTVGTAQAVNELKKYLKGGPDWKLLEDQFGGDHFACLYEIEIDHREIRPSSEPRLERKWPYQNWSLTAMDCSGT